MPGWTTARVVHVATRNAWDVALAEGTYLPSGFALDGYIHCSTPWQAVRIINMKFAGCGDLVLLVIDPGRVPAAVVFENCDGGLEPFPHIYGPLPVEAVVSVLPLRWQENRASFEFPAGWATAEPAEEPGHWAGGERLAAERLQPRQPRHPAPEVLMRPQPLIAVTDVEASSRWYQRLLGCQSAHGGTEYERLVSNGVLILQLHRFDVEHHHGAIGNPDERPYGNGVLLWFEIDDFDAAVARVAELNAEIVLPRHRNPPDGDGGPNHWECWLRDPDGYTVVLASPDGSADGTWRH